MTGFLATRAFVAVSGGFRQELAWHGGAGVALRGAYRLVTGAAAAQLRRARRPAGAELIRLELAMAPALEEGPAGREALVIRHRARPIPIA